MSRRQIEDSLSFLPPLAFLVAVRIAGRPPTPRPPYGCHRSVGVRVRDEVHVFHVEAFAVPVDGVGPTLEQLAAARRCCADLDRKIEDVVLAPVAELPEDQVPR